MEKILVGTETSARAERAVETAVGLAAALDAELIVLYVKPPLDAREVFDPEKMPEGGAMAAVRTMSRVRGGE